jgi:hypothetical protein
MLGVVISSLNPTYIMVHPDHVQIGLGGGFYHFGVRGFSEGVQGACDLELIEGLWFYSEDGRVPPPRVD